MSRLQNSMVRLVPPSTLEMSAHLKVVLWRNIYGQEANDLNGNLLKRKETDRARVSVCELDV